MGNCLQFLFEWMRLSRAADDVVPRKVAINCACFHSKIIDDETSSEDSEEKR